MKIKSLATIALLSLAAIAARAADDGDILEFRPITETVTAENPFDASREIKFIMRLLPGDYSTEKPYDGNRWEIYCKDPLKTTDIQIATLTPSVVYNEELCGQLGIAVPAN